MDTIGKKYRCKRDTFDIHGRLICHGFVTMVKGHYLDINVLQHSGYKVSDKCLEQNFEEITD